MTEDDKNTNANSFLPIACIWNRQQVYIVQAFQCWVKLQQFLVRKQSERLVRSDKNIFYSSAMCNENKPGILHKYTFWVESPIDFAKKRVKVDQLLIFLLSFHEFCSENRPFWLNRTPRSSSNGPMLITEKSI